MTKRKPGRKPLNLSPEYLAERNRRGVMRHYYRNVARIKRQQGDLKAALKAEKKMELYAILDPEEFVQLQGQ